MYVAVFRHIYAAVHQSLGIDNIACWELDLALPAIEYDVPPILICVVRPGPIVWCVRAWPCLMFYLNHAFGLCTWGTFRKRCPEIFYSDTKISQTQKRPLQNFYIYHAQIDHKSNRHSIPVFSLRCISTSHIYISCTKTKKKHEINYTITSSYKQL